MSKTTENHWDAVFSGAVENGLFPRIINRALFSGAPRTGKSSLPVKLFGRDNVERNTFHPQQPADDLIGGYSLVNGSTKWCDGPLVRAMRAGKIFIADEIERHSPELYSFLLAALDDPPRITLPTGEVVEAAEGFGVVATSNELPSVLPDALRDRFDLVLRVHTLSQPLQDFLGPLAKPAQSALDRKAKEAWSREPTPNLFIALRKLQRNGVDNETAVKALGIVGQDAADLLTTIAAAAL